MKHQAPGSLPPSWFTGIFLKFPFGRFFWKREAFVKGRLHRREASGCSALLSQFVSSHGVMAPSPGALSRETVINRLCRNPMRTVSEPSARRNLFAGGGSCLDIDEVSYRIVLRTPTPGPSMVPGPREAQSPRELLFFLKDWFQPLQGSTQAHPRLRDFGPGRAVRAIPAVRAGPWLGHRLEVQGSHRCPRSSDLHPSAVHWR